MCEQRENVNRTRLVSRADLILLAVVLLLAGAALVFYETHNEQGKLVRIRVGSETVEVLPLGKDRTYEVKTGEGSNPVVIKSGTVSVESADCPDKICVRHKPVDSVGETIICLPHKLVVEVVE